jgi:AcrR family transcriptional regulator
MKERNMGKDEKTNIMNELARQGDRRMTVREVAEQLGCNPETVKRHIRELFPCLMQNGKATLLDEKQVTVILESIKKSTAEHRGLESVNLQRSVAGTETALTPALKLEMLYRQIDEIKTAEIARLNADLAEARQLLYYRTAGLETIQRIAEAGGIVKSDRDDVLDTYRRRR